MCEACSVFDIHYKYMAEVLEKNIRSSELSTIHSKGNFMERAMGCVKT